MRKFGFSNTSLWSGSTICYLVVLVLVGLVRAENISCNLPFHMIQGFHGVSNLKSSNVGHSGKGWGKWNRNESHLDWEVAETEHFRFYYDKGLLHVAEYIAGLAEKVYEQKIKRYQITLPGKVEFVVREDIIANGWANAYQNTMQIWVADWGIPLRSTHDWIKDVVTHELAHIISIQSGSKLPSSIFGLVVGYQDYYNERVQSSFSTLFPFTSQPNWFAEGVAQYESELSGYDAWDSHRDMILRTAVLEDSLLDYGRMGVFAGKGLHYEQGPYTQGFAFVRYLADRYGDDFVLNLWKENARFYRQTLSGSMQRMVGKSGPELWKEWHGSLKTHYGEMVENLGEIHEGEKLTEGSFFNYYPHWNPEGDEVYFVSNKGRKGFGGILYTYQFADTVKDEERLKPVSGTIRGYFDVLSDDSTFLYSSAKDGDENGQATLDIYTKNIKEKKSKWWNVTKWFSSEKPDSEPDLSNLTLTKDVNAIHPHVNAQENEVVFVTYHNTNFYLATASLLDNEEEEQEGTVLESEDIEFLYPKEEDMEGHFGFNIYTPKFSPNGGQILFSYFDGASRKIGLINRDGSGFRSVLNRPYADRDPEWSPDGKSFFYASDSSGIYNIYQYFFVNKGSYKAGNSYPVTNVVGSAFAPTIHPDGKQLAYVQYDKDGFSLYHLENVDSLTSRSSVHFSHSPREVSKKDTSVIEPVSFSDARSYIGIPNRGIIQPILIGQEALGLDKNAQKGETKWMAGVSTFWNDPIGRNQLTLSFLTEVGNGWDYFDLSRGFLKSNKESEMYAGFWNHSFPISLGIEYIRRNITTLDTATINNDQGRIDTVESHQAIVLQNIQGSMRYSLADQGSGSDPSKLSFVSLVGGLATTETDLYDIPFKFEFYNNKYIAPTFFYYGVKPSSKSNIAPQGLALFANYSFNWTQLLRRGNSFRETFVFENGVIKERFRDFHLQQFQGGLDYGIALPWSSESSLRFSGQVGSIVQWKRIGEGVDTLDTFLDLGMFVRGYPYLQDRENVLFRGENTVKWSVDYNQVLWGNLYKRYWIFFLEDVYGHLFWEAGRAWNGKLAQVGFWDKELWTGAPREDRWYQSVGWGVKLNSRIYHNFPFNVFFESSTALNSIPSLSAGEGEGGYEKLSPIKVFGVNTLATRISMGVSFGFYNGLLGGVPDMRNKRWSALRFR